MTLYIKDLDGAEALEVEQLVRIFEGYGVVAGGEVTAGANPFDVDVTATTAYVNGTKQNTATTQLDLEPYVSTDNPRKVVVYVDDAGDVDVLAGDPEEPQPPDETRFNTYRPAPPDFLEESQTGVVTKLKGTPLAEVWLDQNDERVTDDDIRDRRLPSSVTLEEIDVSSLTVDSLTDGTGTTHGGELADATDVPSEADVISYIDNDASHGSDAPHDYRTDMEIRTAVENSVDAADLASDSGVAGTYLRSEADDSAVWAEIPALEAPELDSGTVTHTGGGPTTVTIQGVTTDEASQFDLVLGMESGLATQYGWNHEWSRAWDSSNGHWDLTITFTWDDDPGSGTDATVSYTVYDAAPQVVSGRFTSPDAVAAMDGASITPAAVDVGQALELPVYDDLTNHVGPTEGDIAIASGDGTDTAGLYIYDDAGSAWVGPVVAEALLSTLTIDGHKDWQSYQIRNLGAPQYDQSAARKTEVDAVQSNLDTHAGDVDAHHARPTAEEIQDTIGTILDATLAYDDATPAMGVADGAITPTQADLTQSWNFTAGLESGGEPVVTDAAADIQAAPNLSFSAELGADGTGNDEYATPVTVPADGTLNVYAVHLSLLDGSEAPAGIEFEITDGSGSVVGTPSAVSGRGNTSDPVMTWTNPSSSSDATVFLTVDNDTGNEYSRDSSNPNGVGVEVAYRVE